MSFAEIILDHKSSKVDKPFTYRIPSNMEDHAITGVRVAVPFGRYNKPTMGIIVDTKVESGISSKTKDILQVLDERPLITHNGLLLAKWMKNEYLCTYFEAMQPILPPGDFRDISTIVEKGKFFNLYSPETQDETSLLEIISTISKIEYGELREKVNSRDFHKIIQKLEDQDTIRLVLEIKKKSTSKFEDILIRNKELSLEAGIKLIGNRAKKQLELWENLQYGDEKPVKEILKEFNSSTSVLKELEKKGLIFLKKSLVNENPLPKPIADYGKILLNLDQKMVLDGIIESERKYHLIHGITGSGKTEIYLQLVESMLNHGKDTVILVPEISLTPQTIDRFVGRFGNKVAILHSKLTQLERFDQWRRIKSGEYKIVVGARSALFAPFKNLGLVVIDEEHENTYKSSNNPKYNTVDVAKVICEMEDAKLVLGTATPSIETYHRSKTGEYELFELQSRATRNTLPTIEVIDMREELESGNRSIFSRSLLEGMANTLDEKNQIILFLNRRGYAGFITCRTCGFVAKCNNCDISLTYHRSTNRLRCHYCGDTHPVPKVCPSCGSKYFKSFGIGTEKVEEEFGRLFPQARIQRMDSDSVRTREDYDKALASMKKRKIDVLIGTQMISKGLDFPGVTLVGIIAADTSLNLPDFRSPERTFQLVTQVAGRAGRGVDPGKVILQTYNPDHYSIITAMNNDYKEFFNHESKLRKEFGYPPYKELLTVTIFGPDHGHVKEAMEQSSVNILHHIKEQNLEGIDILGPNPAPLERINNNYRWQILLKFDYNMNESIKKIINRVYIEDKDKFKYDDIKISIDVNPSSIL